MICSHRLCLTCLASLQVGDGKETIRNRVRGIFKSICSVYPYSKVFAALLEHGLPSKNARVRAESADELGSLFQRHGATAFPVGKALPLIAKLISDRDTTVRTAALHAIGAVYTLVGADATWKHVGSIPDKERSMLEERLKRTAGAPSNASAAASAPARSATPVQRPGAGTPSRLPPPDRSSATASPASNGIPAPSARALPGKGISRLARPQSVALPSHFNAETNGAAPSPRKSVGGLPQPRQLARPSGVSVSSSRIPSNPTSIASSLPDFGDDDLNPADLIDSIDTNDLAKCADVLKRVQSAIASAPDTLVPEADNLVEIVTLKMGLGFDELDASASQAKLRLCKHLMQTLTAFFDHRTLGQAVSADRLTALLAELTGRLLDTAEKPESDAISSLSKVLNMVLIRIFHNADQGACFR